jgi:transmembrane sensor
MPRNRQNSTRGLLCPGRIAWRFGDWRPHGIARSGSGSCVPQRMNNPLPVRNANSDRYCSVSRPGEKTYSTALGARKTIMLADGSSIELNTDTVLRMTIGAAARTASLDKGEAYFQIKHNVVHPFVVMAGNHRVTDLGTKFVIRNDADELKVTLLEGRVRFDAHARHPILLTPGDELVATATSVSTMRKSAEQLSNELGWKRGLLIFQNTPLAEAAAEFNRYNSRKLIVADAAVGRRTIGASFPSDNVELFAQMARDVLRLHVEDRGDEIVISR